MKCIVVIKYLISGFKMPPVQNCSIVHRGNISPNDSSRNRGSAEEEWVTKKTVEITTTKNIERKVYRQLVLEDGRVLDEEVPTITIDRTEDKKIFETDHDEERDVEDNKNDKAVNSTFDTDDGALVGDKFTTVKTTKDIKENVTRTEAVQNIGNIRSRVSLHLLCVHLEFNYNFQEVKTVLTDKKNIGKYIKKTEKEQYQVRIFLFYIF